MQTRLLQTERSYRFQTYFILLILGVLALLSSCGDDSDPISDRVAADNATIKQYLADSSIVALADESGIFYSIDTANAPGDTQPLNGSILSIYYTASVLYGDTYEINTETSGNDPLLLKQGVNAVYPVGLDIGLAYMKQGETFTFYIPSELAYRDFSYSTLIPEYAILVITVELVDIQNEFDIYNQEITLIDDYIRTNQLDSTNIDPITSDTTLYHPLDSVEFMEPGFYYKRQSQGLLNDTLLIGDPASFTYTGYTLDSTEFDRRGLTEPFLFTFGNGSMIEGLEVGMGAMERNEAALFIIPSMNGYKESVFVVPSYLKQDFVDLDIIPQYSAKVAPFEVILFETQLLTN